MDITVNQITRVILGINIPVIPASYIIKADDTFDFTKTINEVVYTRQFVTQGMINLGQFPISSLSLPLYIDSSTGNLTTQSTNNVASLVTKNASKTYDFVDTPTKFSVQDVITAKANFILSSEMYKYIMLDELIDFSMIDTTQNQYANLGIKRVELGPGGSITTFPITLNEAANMFGVYIESDPNIGVQLGYVSNGVTIFNNVTNNIPLIIPSSISQAYLKFTNSGSSTQLIYAYALLY